MHFISIQFLFSIPQIQHPNGLLKEENKIQLQMYKGQ